MREVIQAQFKGNYQAFYGKYLKTAGPSGANNLMAHCPFGTHEDKKPSFSFNNATGQYYCHTCGKKGHAFHFYAKLHGLDTKRDFPKILKGIASDFGIPWQDRERRIVKIYDYLNADGELHSQTLRYEPKDFAQRRPDGSGGWIWKNVFKDVQPILYHLPEVLNASEVLIVEGEKDCDNLSDLGFVATTCPMGAKKWRKHYNEYLKDKHVVLIPDNDPEGREHMVQVGSSLNGTAASLKWIDLPDLPAKGDVSVWIQKVGDKETAAERLAVMIECAGNYEPPKTVSLEDAILDDHTFSTIELPTKRIILNPWLKEQTITLVPGWRGVGKTWFCMGIVDAVTRGQPFGPWAIGESVSCLYLEAGIAAEDVRERFRDLNPSRKRKQSLYIYSAAYANQLGLSDANLLSESWRTKMKSILIARGIKLLVLDNLASLTRGIDENLKRDWDPINQWLLELRFAGIATIMPHHTNKTGDQRGTSAREDNIDTTVILKSPSDYVPEDGAKFIASFKKARIKTEDLKLISDCQFQWTSDDQDQLVWTWGSVRRETKIEILRLLNEGFSQKDVADTLNIDKAYVSRTRKQAIKDGYLSAKNKLTQTGFRMLQDDEILVNWQVN